MAEARATEEDEPKLTPDDRERLRRWLARDAFLRDGDHGIQLVGADGGRRDWMLYTWAVTATSAGARLIARGVLDQLAGLSGTQLAAYGVTAGPIVSSCVVLDERYSALAVRARAKDHGTRWRVDGVRDRGRRVVVVDDSLSSGRSFLQAATILESEGFEVEGLVVVAEFPGRGGRQYVESLGYQVRALFDVWTDLEAATPSPAPTLRGAPPAWSEEAIPDGLHPAVAARYVLDRLAKGEATPRPPARLDRAVDGRGGVFVSVRRRSDDRRLARDGFWHFDETLAEPENDLVLAATATARRLGTTLTPDLLDDVKIAVSFLGPFEATTDADLDFDRFGIVVRSRAWAAKVGGALPNTQYYTSTLEQYRHARWVNARIDDIEPHDIFRHTVAKYAEPGETWPEFGVAATETDGWVAAPSLGERLASRARAVLGGSGSDVDRLDDTVVPVPIAAVTVALYSPSPPHRVVGHGMARAGSLDAMVADAVASARDAARATHTTEHEEYREHDLGDTTVCLSLLYHRETHAPMDAPAPLRCGRDAVEAGEGDRRRLITEYSVVHHDWRSAAQVGQAMTRMTGTTKPVWSTYKSATWLDRPGDEVRRLRSGFPERSGPVGPADIELVAGHLWRSLDADGWPAYAYEPRTGAYERRGTAARCVHGLRALLDAGQVLGRQDWVADARRGRDHALRYLDRTDGTLRVPEHEGSEMAVAGLLAMAEPDSPGTDDGSWADTLAGHLASWVRPDGSIRPPGMVPTRSEPDYFPGAVILGLARYRRARGRRVDVDVPKMIEFYRHRFRCLRGWHLASWQAQGWSEWHRSGPADAPESAAVGDVVFELADWMISHQLRVDGSYLVDLGAQTPSVLTAFVAEGVGAAWRLAEHVGDGPRARAYGDSWRAAMSFLDRLVVRREDTFWMADPDAALGGVRAMPCASGIRADYMSHTLSALLHGVGMPEPS